VKVSNVAMQLTSVGHKTMRNIALKLLVQPLDQII
jgi:hypothetical protein